MIMTKLQRKSHFFPNVISVVLVTILSRFLANSICNTSDEVLDFLTDKYFQSLGFFI